VTLIDNPQEALDKLRAVLWAMENLSDGDDLIECVPEYRDEDIDHLREILTYWRSSELSIARHSAEDSTENAFGVRKRVTNKN
jgi:hypothetical protein